MSTICNLWKPIGLGSFVVLVVLVACASGLKDTVVTKDNQAEISEQVKEELTYEEVQLLNSYGARTAPDLEEGQLPVGKSVGEMIKIQRTFEERDQVESGDQPSTVQAELHVDDPVRSSADNQVAKVSNPTYDQPEKQQTVVEPAALPPPSTTAVVPAGTVAEKQQTVVEPTPPPPAPTTAVVPAGSVLEVRLQEYLSTKTNQAGESVEMQLDEDLIVDGKLLAPEASLVIGRLTHVKRSGKVEGLAQMGIDLQKIVVGDEEYSLKSNILSYEAEGTVKEDAKKIGIATGVGALIGAIAGGKKGAAVGTAVGAGAGTGTVLATSGEEVEFDIEQPFQFVLERDVEMKIVRSE